MSPGAAEEILSRGWLLQAVGVGCAAQLETAAQRGGHARMAARVTAGVQLADHAAPPRLAGRLQVGARGVFHHHGFGHVAGAVAAVERQIAARVPDAVAVKRVVPVHAALQQPRVRVDQQLVRVEPVAALGFIGPVDAVAVQLAWAQVRQVAVPDLVRVLGQRHPRRLAPTAGIEKAQLDPLGVHREQREVDAAAVPVGAERIRRAGPHAGRTGWGHARSPQAIDAAPPAKGRQAISSTSARTGPLASQSRKFTYCSGRSKSSSLRSSAMAACRSSRFLPDTRSSSPWMAACTFSLLSLMCLTSLRAWSESMP